MIDFDSPSSLHPMIREAFADYDRSLEGRAAAAEITNRMYEMLRKAAKLAGMEPLYEVHAWVPHRAGERGNCWGVSWEAGPYEWAISASFLIMDLTGRLVEPHYSFDLCFYEAE